MRPIKPYMYVKVCKLQKSSELFNTGFKSRPISFMSTLRPHL